MTKEVEQILEMLKQEANYHWNQAAIGEEKDMTKNLIISKAMTDVRKKIEEKFTIKEIENEHRQDS